MTSGDAYSAMVGEDRKPEEAIRVMDTIDRLYAHYSSIVVVRHD